MRYMGGKVRIAKRVARVIREYSAPGLLIWEPFCGGLGVTAELSETNPVFASDVHRALIALYEAVAAGWDPPQRLSEREYRAARDLPDSDPLKAFAGFGCSFGGRWSGGYARAGARNFAAAARTAILRDVARVVGAGGAFACGSCFDVEPSVALAPPLIYCDPPYAGTTPYAGTPAFDHDRFVAWVDAWACFCRVLVSEYSFPVGRCVAEIERKSMVSGDKTPRPRVERIFLVDNRYL